MVSLGSRLRISVGDLSWFRWEGAGGMCLDVWVRSRQNPDGILYVVQLYRGFVLGSFLPDDHYVLGSV